MPIGLRDGVSFCEAGGHLLFLDVPADRYFALGAQADVAFRALCDAPHDAPCFALLPLIESGFLVDAPDAPPLRACPGLPVAQASLLDRPLPRVSSAAVLGAAARLLRMRVRLRARGLASVLDAVAQARDRHRATPFASHRLGAIAAAFARSTALTRSHDQCLIRSAAAAIRFAAAGVPVALVIGVRVRPFAAHSWLQTGDQLVNDELDNVRGYTPILIL